MSNRVAVGVLVAALMACGGGDGADAEAFCDAVDSFGALNVLDLSPEEGPAAVREARTLLDRARSTAPDEIKSSYELIMDAFLPLMDVMESSDFGQSPVDEAALAEASVLFGSDEVQAASNSVAQWMDANCPPS